ncbi:hypothetical protein K435DRAFT_797890 [Dendrothele bispora CBS 962.96]|uniref:Uncharacterized protein n=1 Tax=Dendrothele bispora (strain CBS 962.96) TaxID=1314807 RepID=A0A4V4HFP9_DENBC|nr:hypothetical protein K435DRAFT_797890 [Dendrothele bispora CBS 962.96]
MSMTIIQSLRNGTSVVVQSTNPVMMTKPKVVSTSWQSFYFLNEKYDTIEQISEVILSDMLPLVCAEIMTALMDHSIQVPPLEESETQQRRYKKSQRLQQKSGAQRKELDENIETFKWGKGLYYWQEINEE